MGNWSYNPTYRAGVITAFITGPPCECFGCLFIHNPILEEKKPLENGYIYHLSREVRKIIDSKEVPVGRGYSLVPWRVYIYIYPGYFWDLCRKNKKTIFNDGILTTKIHRNLGRNKCPDCQANLGLGNKSPAIFSWQPLGPLLKVKLLVGYM